MAGSAKPGMGLTGFRLVTENASPGVVRHENDS